MFYFDYLLIKGEQKKADYVDINASNASRHRSSGMNRQIEREKKGSGHKIKDTQDCNYINPLIDGFAGPGQGVLWRKS